MGIGCKRSPRTWESITRRWAENSRK